MIMPENKELYVKMFHEVWIEKLQNDTGGQEEAIKNATGRDLAELRISFFAVPRFSSLKF